ncbi:ribokinase [Methylobacterium frigidaeris]|uniref:Ribokinase n=1 Tax=Methylobacterium frigidaeris TaxID=2038277 RepID=A0AA37HIP3_9HYPH|nr:ribokinase [Methylobacterium frigidaeris]PIK73045.1 ribokinase [Methylobacterium frigidaeris]GJD65880.1 Ribokinase [Methylobacterium frigidaeris]
MILVFGSINVDLVAEVAAIPRPGETVLAPGYATLFGGKGANQAVAAARVSAPGSVALVGRVGDDAFGRLSRDNLAQNGVDVAGVAAGPEPTGCAFITVDAQGENAITVASGANGALSAAALPEIPASATLILQMEVPLAASREVAQRARLSGGRVIWNLAPVPASLAPDDLRAMLAVTDVLVVNEHEARAAAACLGQAEASSEAAAGLLAEAGGVVCVLTAGARGAVAVHPGGARTVAAAKAIQPVDTTGAGDTFVGILAAALDEGRPWTSALARACRGASLACLTPGAQTGMPTADMLMSDTVEASGLT